MYLVPKNLVVKFNEFEAIIQSNGSVIGRHLSLYQGLFHTKPLVPLPAR